MPEPIDALLARFPKERPALPPAHEAIYSAEYRGNRDGTTLATQAAQALERWMHRQVASRSAPGQRLLELGAGTLNHVPFERDFAVYDAIEPLAFMYEGTAERAAVRSIFASSDAIPAENRYDRIFSVAVLEHMLDLPLEIRAAAGRIEPGGVFQVAVPCEGCFAWGAAWRLSTGLAFRLRTGLDYGTIMRHEHVNSFDEIVRLLEHFFARVEARYFPLPHKQLAFYAYLECREPRGTSAGGRE